VARQEGVMAEREAGPVPWHEFAVAAPALAELGRSLLYQFGPGLGFLATVRRDGSPRLHPICPLVVNGRLYAYIGTSPKLGDLLRDGRYALHAFPPEKVDDEFLLCGLAVCVDAPDRRAAVSAAIAAQGTSHGADDVLFEFLIDRAMHAAYRGRGPEFWPPAYTIWRA
jgi:hypothetical protein